MDASVHTNSPLYMDATLRPNRSLSRTGWIVLMAVTAVLIALAAGFYFILGAWPVVGFLGADILIVWLAFRASFRQGRLFEHVRVSAETVAVERRHPNGRVQRWSAEPQFAQVEVDHPGKHHATVRMWSRGEGVVLGAFLAPDERVAFADALRDALRQARAERHPVVNPAE